jgi:hypothetical protein
MYNTDPTPQGVENRNILLWFKCVLTISLGTPISATKVVTEIFLKVVLIT